MFGSNITIFILATESIGQMKWRTDSKIAPNIDSLADLCNKIC